MKQKKRAERLSFFALLSNFCRKFERFYLKESREALFFCATSEFPKGNLEGSFYRIASTIVRVVLGLFME